MADTSLQWKLLIGVICLAVGINGMAMSFPRMSGGKRGKIYFPRLGRSGLDAEHQTCCPLGIVKEWSAAEKGHPHVIRNCSSDECCDGLTEMVEEKKNGGYYLMCVPNPLAVREN